MLTAAPAGAAAPTGLATAPASPGASRTELIRVFYAVLYPYRAESPLAAGWGTQVSEFSSSAGRSRQVRGSLRARREPAAAPGLLRRGVRRGGGNFGGGGAGNGGGVRLYLTPGEFEVGDMQSWGVWGERVTPAYARDVCALLEGRNGTAGGFATRVCGSALARGILMRRAMV